jgi:hypothetical protein
MHCRYGAISLVNDAEFTTQNQQPRTNIAEWRGVDDVEPCALVFTNLEFLFHVISRLERLHIVAD